MTPLEQRYRLVLRLLPASYRRGWEEDMVVTFLHSVLPGDTEEAAFIAEHAWPGTAELASVAALAVRLRLGVPGAPPRYLALGAAARLVALMGLLYQAVLALLGLTGLVWYTLQFPMPGMPDAHVTLAATPWWSTPLTLAGFLWVPAYLTLLAEHWRTARALAAAALVPQVVSFGIGLASADVVLLASRGCWLVVAAVPVLATAAFCRDVPPVRARPWLVALPVGVLAVCGLSLAPLYLMHSYWFDLPGVACVVVCAAGVAYLAAPGVGWGGRNAGRSVALGVVATGVLGMRAVTLVEYLRFATPSHQLDALVTAAAVQTAMTLAVATVLIVIARRALRAMPPDPDTAEAT